MTIGSTFKFHSGLLSLSLKHSPRRNDFRGGLLESNLGIISCQEHEPWMTATQCLNETVDK